MNSALEVPVFPFKSLALLPHAFKNKVSLPILILKSLQLILNHILALFYFSIFPFKFVYLCLQSPSRFGIFPLHLNNSGLLLSLPQSLLEFLVFLSGQSKFFLKILKDAVKVVPESSEFANNPRSPIIILPQHIGKVGKQGLHFLKEI